MTETSDRTDGLRRFVSRPGDAADPQREVADPEHYGLFRTVCGVEVSPGLWICTRPVGHAGAHEAKGSINALVARWDA